LWRAVPFASGVLAALVALLLYLAARPRHLMTGRKTTWGPAMVQHLRAYPSAEQVVAGSHQTQAKGEW
jgi:hypothetical protein